MQLQWLLRLIPQYRQLEDQYFEKIKEAANWMDESLRVASALDAIQHDEVELENTRRTVAELQHENDKLTDRVDALLEDRKQLWTSFQESLRSERASYQLGINSAVQRMNGGIPYPEAPHLAAQTATQPGESISVGRPGHISISDRVNAASSQYLQSKLARS